MTDLPATDLHSLIRTERESFVALLETLAPEQWTAQSLCAAWTVENVAAHLAWAPANSVLQMLPDTLRAAFRTNKLIGDSAIRWSARGRPAILAQLRSNVETGTKPFGVPYEAGLADALVHALDVRVPLGIPREIPDDAFHRAADWTANVGWPIAVAIGGPVRKRLSGVRLVATDTDWSWGSGREVRLSKEEILLALTDRLRPATGP